MRKSLWATVCVLVGLLAPLQAAEKQPTFDTLIRGARVVDGTGGKAFVADVAIADGRIAKIGKLPNARAQNVIDGRGMILCPGFVDLHNHGDRGVLKFRDAENFVRQGATTLVCGNCGSSPTDVVGFMRKLRDGGAGVNVVFQLGHGSVRTAVLGPFNVAPSKQQLEQMQTRVRRAMEAGAVGMTTGLRYKPGAYATAEEVTALAKELAPYGGFYATHMRDEGVYILDALNEALQIGRDADVPVHISHHKISSVSVWGLTRLTLDKIDKARAAGMDVSIDQYPYAAGSGGVSLYVPQSSLSGGLEKYRQRIADPVQRKKIVAAVEELLVRKIYPPSAKTDDPQLTAAALTRIQIARAKHDLKLEGMNLTEILRYRKQPVTLRNGAELLLELVAHGVGGINHTLDNGPGGDVERVMQHPQTCIASDGGLFAFGQGNPHPRSYGTYPRALAHYVRKKKLLTIEQAIHKMSGLPARRLGWTDRGLVKEGYWADVVLLNPEKVQDVATFQSPHHQSQGVRDVLIRGQFVLRDGKMTGNRPGRPVFSVPSANTPSTRLRRELLEILQRIDGRFALLVQDEKGKEFLAINADDLFSDIGQKRDQEISLRELAKNADSSNTDKNSSVFRHQSITQNAERKLRLTLVYNKLAPQDRDAIDRLVFKPIVAAIKGSANK